MKVDLIKKYLIIGSLALAPFTAKSQKMQDSLSHKVNKTDIELVYNHYFQDGDNSAITGGLGTEKLMVYGPALAVKRTIGKNAFSLNLGADIISSASTDNIDFVQSSASALDTRSHLQVSYERAIGSEGFSISGSTGFSLESDYFSVNGELTVQKKSESKLRSITAQFSFFDDDLRWGRLDQGNWKPQYLIYPKELRSREWYEGYKRNSYNLKLAFTQVLNKKNILGVYPEISYQTGLLETPFHRIYFSDGSLGVEQLPDQRFKTALALKLNSFMGRKFILKNTLNGYVDNFGIQAFALENESVYKLHTSWSILIGFRFYQQRASRYFKPYEQHLVSDDYYTSDYDLSDFQTYSIGAGVKYYPNWFFGKKGLFETIVLKYNYMHRSNQLSAHTLSFIFKGSVRKPTYCLKPPSII